MFDDERSSKRFLTLENSKASFNNNVSHLEVVDEIIDNTTIPPTITTKKIQPLTPKKFSRNLLNNSKQYMIFSRRLTAQKRK